VKDDEALIDEALDGDSSAFGQLVTRYQDRLYNSMLHLAGSPDLACDAVQDAFVQAYVKLDTFGRQSAFYTWLYRIAFNLAVSHRRREKPALSVDHARDALGQEPLDRELAPEARLEEQERALQVRAALARLSDEHRAILVLREIDGHTYEEIAEILDVPLGTIRSRLHRARLQLRDELKCILHEDVR
jgi:RNA polymerase sigma-70 factor (ECF subfamily)